jgi:hypothetical protein
MLAIGLTKTGFQHGDAWRTTVTTEEARHPRGTFGTTWRRDELREFRFSEFLRAEILSIPKANPDRPSLRFSRAAYDEPCDCSPPSLSPGFEQIVRTLPYPHHIARLDSLIQETNHRGTSIQPHKPAGQRQTQAPTRFVAMVQSRAAQYPRRQRIRALPHHPIRQTRATKLVRRVSRHPTVRATLQPDHAHPSTAAAEHNPRS